MNPADDALSAMVSCRPIRQFSIRLSISSTIADHALTREALEQELGDRVRASVYFQEGVAAFREKRKPKY